MCKKYTSSKLKCCHVGSSLITQFSVLKILYNVRRFSTKWICQILGFLWLCYQTDSVFIKVCWLLRHYQFDQACACIGVCKCIMYISVCLLLTEEFVLGSWGRVFNYIRPHCLECQWNKWFLHINVNCIIMLFYSNGVMNSISSLWTTVFNYQ